MDAWELDIAWHSFQKVLELSISFEYIFIPNVILNGINEIYQSYIVIQFASSEASNHEAKYGTLNLLTLRYKFIFSFSEAALSDQ